MNLTALSALACAVLLLSCDRSPDPAPDPTPIDTIAAPAARAAELEAAAADVVEYLRGDGEFAALQLADTVELVVAPEGGGARARHARAELVSLDAWSVGSDAGRVSFVPAAAYDSITAQYGVHFNCMPSSLASRLPELAQHPHVGVLLRRADGNCLQTWNATFVFDTTSANSAIVAVIFDQWEW